MQRPVGPITVATPGTPVVVTTEAIRCQSILFQALSNGTHTNTGRVYILAQNQTTPASFTRVATLAIPTSNTIPSFSVTIPDAPGGLALAGYMVDADNAGDGVDVSYARP